MSAFQNEWLTGWQAAGWKNAKGNTIRNVEQWKDNLEPSLSTFQKGDEGGVMARSIMEPRGAYECYNCGDTRNLEEHHVFFGIKAKKEVGALRVKSTSVLDATGTKKRESTAET